MDTIKRGDGKFLRNRHRKYVAAGDKRSLKEFLRGSFKSDIGVFVQQWFARKRDAA